MNEQKLSIEEAFNNVVLCYDQFFSGNKNQHVLMAKSLETIKEALDIHLATEAEKAKRASEQAQVESSENGS